MHQGNRMAAAREIVALSMYGSKHMKFAETKTKRTCRRPLHHIRHVHIYVYIFCVTRIDVNNNICVLCSFSNYNSNVQTQSMATWFFVVVVAWHRSIDVIASN